ncbi:MULTISPECIES: hydrogen gas-evolving membrane-bound hydrogenase subunit E [Rhizobium]|uniref:Na+/H+ antiporter MnhB subunit-related protein n=1 Tax=Rhizobium favelukesii TaxID=348824 RepID=W6RTT8_9HYPH|nr:MULTISPECIES: hydrogen gas-evolving membrane-bound hydrogenase subunit E [Rhizobium]MCS0461924.1 sodium:proton antiporter [Rhizobium favelukesii]UFS80345.1 sodium:proton antiporter [Rhizobium sp. T136]CDM62158.1 Na+/H+ antiporter MnhB subunit-related protein [Rhizobium favelukesii]
MRRAFSLLAVLAFAVIFAGLVSDYGERQTLSALAVHYLTQVPADLGAPNVVTGILITFRGFDTLGEVAVLFMVAASVGLLLASEADETPFSKPVGVTQGPSELVRNGAEVVLPVIFLFGAYVIINGHLSAGGGFQGGAVVASGVMLLMLAYPSAPLHHAFLSITESLAGVFYVSIGIVGIAFGGGFLDSHILPRGNFGTLFSAGAIPLISALLGIKVGAELSVIIDRFRN